MQQFTDILVTKEGGVARIVINRPDVLNALRSQTYAELTAAFTDAADDDEVGVVVLSGAGDRAFSSGGDVRGQAERTPASGRRHLRRMIDLAAAIRNNGKPVIAAVDGYAIGGGHELHSCATSRSRRTGPSSVRSGPAWAAYRSGARPSCSLGSSARSGPGR